MGNLCSSCPCCKYQDSDRSEHQDNELNDWGRHHKTAKSYDYRPKRHNYYYPKYPKPRILVTSSYYTESTASSSEYEYEYETTDSYEYASSSSDSSYDMVFEISEEFLNTRKTLG